MKDLISLFRYVTQDFDRLSFERQGEHISFEKVNRLEATDFLILSYLYSFTNSNNIAAPIQAGRPIIQKSFLAPRVTNHIKMLFCIIS